MHLDARTHSHINGHFPPVPVMPENLPEDLPEDLSGRLPENLPEDLSNRLPKNLVKISAENSPKTVSKTFSEASPEASSEYLPESQTAHLVKNLPENLPENLHGKLPENLFKNLPEKLPENLPENLSKSLSEGKNLRNGLENPEARQTENTVKRLETEPLHSSHLHSNRFSSQNIPVLTVEGVSFSYGKQEILHNVNFLVTQGKVCGLLGPNGSGKSTLFKCCMHFLQPSAGKIQVNDLETARLTPKELARHISYVPQEHRQAFSFPVREVVRMGRTPHMRFILSARDKELADEAMEKLGIAHLAHMPCHELSGGQRQLVLIARAVAQGAPLMLLDEPTSALDFHNQIMVWSALRSIAETGTAIVVCCHDPNHILWFCDQVVALRKGKVLACDNPITAVNNGLLQKIFGESCTHSHINGVPVVHPRFTGHENA